MKGYFSCLLVAFRSSSSFSVMHKNTLKEQSKLSEQVSQDSNYQCIPCFSNSSIAFRSNSSSSSSVRCCNRSDKDYIAGISGYRYPRTRAHAHAHPHISTPTQTHINTYTNNIYTHTDTHIMNRCSCTGYVYTHTRARCTHWDKWAYTVHMQYI